MIHLMNVPGWSGSLKELADALGDLRYDALRDFLAALSEKLERDKIADYDRKRIRLGIELHHASAALDKAFRNIDEAWRISEPFMKE